MLSLCEAVWDTYKTIFAGLEDAVRKILRRFAEHSIPLDSGGKLPEWNESVRYKWKEGARFVSEICFLGT